MRYLVVDGELNSTGLKEGYTKKEINPGSLNLSVSLQKRIAEWVKKYSDAHINGFLNSNTDDLDSEGHLICQELHKEIPSVKIEYVSAATMVRTSFFS